MPTEVIFRLPRALERLILRCHLDLASLPFLPPALTDLRIPRVLFRKENVFQDLPASLTVLSASFHRMTPQICAALPRSLTRLEVWRTAKSTKPGSYANLPPNLLRFTCTYSGEMGNFEEGDLPPNLTKLKLFGNTKITDAGLRTLPKSITSLGIEGHVITGAAFSEFKNLLSLHISSYSFLKTTIPTLPASLTELSFSYPPLTSEQFKQMPPRLRKLSCEGDKMDLINAIQYLPPSVTLVHINYKPIHVRLKN